MNNSLKEAILKTLVYSDIFDYPLTKEEIHKFLTGKKTKQKSINEILDKTVEISKNGKFFCLKGRESIFRKRKEREKESKEKLRENIKLIKLLRFLPFIKFVGISGGLSIKNAEKDDDIDLFIITSNNIWTARFFSILLFKLLKKHRSRKTRDVKDKFCLNMFIRGDSLAFEDNKKNIYTAREILQIIPVINKGGLYEKFIKENSWVFGFFPNFYSKNSGDLEPNFKNSVFTIPIELVLKKVQLILIKRKKTREIVENGLLAFHPFDFSAFVLKKYQEGLRKYSLLLSEKGY